MSTHYNTVLSALQATVSPRGQRVWAILPLAFCMAGSLIFSGCLPSAPTNRKDLIAQAESDLNAGNFHQAFRSLSKLVREDPNNAQIQTDLGWVYIYSDNVTKASEQIKKVAARNPDYPRLAYLRGALYEKLGQDIDALAAYNEALKTEVNNPRLHRDIADVFLKLNAPDAALREYDTARRLDPVDSSAHFGRCVSYRQLHDYDKAIEACQSALALTANDADKEPIQEVIETITLLRSLEGNKPDAKTDGEGSGADPGTPPPPPEAAAESQQGVPQD